MAMVASALIFVLTVNALQCAPIKPKDYGNDINQMRNDDEFDEENSSMMNSVENTDKRKPEIETPDCNSYDCPDYTIMDDIISANTKTLNIPSVFRENVSCLDDISEFMGFDIKLSPDIQKHGKKRRRRASLGDHLEWPKVKMGWVYIPYVTSDFLSAEVKQNLTAAILDYNKYTCIRLINRTTENDYLRISDISGCWSWIGKRNNAQDLSLSSGCYAKGTIIHEIMHALGFFHEQSRRDRDRYIKIHWDNIESDWHSQFEMVNYGVAFAYGESYDYNSVMHYGNKGAAINRTGNAITAIGNPSLKLGQRNGFSEQDLREINLKYECGREYVQYE